MRNVAISLKDVSKAYPSWKEPSERFWSLFGRKRAIRDPFWALKDVTLEIEKGMSIGVVGRNGAGKSTLMQLIAGTVEPTSGSVNVNGRVSPLLELGAGFNPEFTGWENAELSGAILGLSPLELKRKLDSIAAFADIGSFIEKPVKTYSSGMFARLAFSVAVHVEPDILLVDEILSVGDMGFQHRCLARLREMRQRGLTLIFVSHGQDAIKSVCSHAAFLHQGRIVHFGSADDTIDRYLAFIREEANKERLLEEAHWGPATPANPKHGGTLRYGTGHVQIERVEIRDETGAPRRAFALSQMIVIEVGLRSSVDVEHLSASFVVRDATGVDILGTTTFDEGKRLPAMSASGRQKVQFRFKNCLRPGSYGVSVAITRVSRRDYTDNIIFDQAEGIASFMVIEDAERPVHYKVHQDIEVSTEDASTEMTSVSRLRRA
jgi:lipopolysaccharide transport system ATP-binding protein